MNKGEAAAFTLILALLLLFTIGAREFYSPISINIVVGHSMYPSLKQGDLVIGASTSLDKYKTGDIVIYCRTANYCIIHRVLNMSDGTVITKGDFNPIPDPPVSSNDVKYKVILSVPAPLWITLLFAVSALSYLNVKNLRSSLFSPFVLESILYIFVLAVLVLSFVIAIVQYPGRADEIQVPGATLRSIELSPDRSTAIIRYNLNDLELRSIESCNAGAGGITYQCTGSLYNDSTMFINIPSGLYQSMFDSGETYFRLNLTLSLDKCTLIGSYPLTIDWKPPNLSIENSTILVIENRNPVPLQIINSTVYYMNATAYYGSPLLVETLHIINSTVLPPMGKLSKSIQAKYDYAYVEVYYEYRNQTVRWVGRADFTEK
jgi:signal peptidase I